jgi:hypothetical protein
MQLRSLAALSLAYVAASTSACSINRSALAPPAGDTGTSAPDSTVEGDSSIRDTSVDSTSADSSPPVDTSVAMDSGPTDASTAADSDTGSGCEAAAEECDGLDQDCDMRVDEGLATCGDCERRSNGRRSYLFCHDGAVRRDWASARDYCRAQGYDLVVVGNATENEWLRMTASGIESGILRWWIGASDTATEGTYVWSATGAPVSWFNWNTVGNPQPNDDIRAGDEDFVFLETNPEGTWFDHFVSTERFICESL